MRCAEVHLNARILMEVRMNRRVFSGAATACGFALALATACSDRGTNRTTTGTAANESAARPTITVTGCLQKGDLGSDYILTEVNHSRTSVGTSGSNQPAGSDAVGREQIHEAERSYRLAADSDRLEPLVGKEVRVSGTVDRDSKLNERDANGSLKDQDRTKIDDKDLARVQVTSIEQIAEQCSGASNGARQP